MRCGPFGAKSKAGSKKTEGAAAMCVHCQPGKSRDGRGVVYIHVCCRHSCASASMHMPCMRAAFPIMCLLHLVAEAFWPSCSCC